MEKKHFTRISSYSHSIDFDKGHVIIGERINPTGKARFKQALRDGDTDYILSEGFAQEEAGAHALDVNVGLPDINEEKTILSVMKELQSVAQDAADSAAGGRRRSRDDGELKGAVKSAVSNYLYKTTKRNPMVIPVVTRL